MVSNHLCPQEMADPLLVCVIIPAVAERECQNPHASAPQPPLACVNVALNTSSNHGIDQVVRVTTFMFQPQGHQKLPEAHIG